MTTEPSWFEQAIAHKPEQHVFKADRVKITCLFWGDRQHPALIFLHGGFANAWWFSHVAPQLSKRFFVVAINFSGHGDSDWRDAYHAEDFLFELDALYETFSLHEAILAGFSFGGRVAYWYSHYKPSAVKQLVLLDPPSVHQPLSKQFIGRFTKTKSMHYYPDAEEILKRFRIIPKQPVVNETIIAYIAQHSIQATPYGYTWLTDPNLFAKLANILPNITFTARKLPPCVLIYGVRSDVCTDAVRNDLLSHHPEIQCYSIAEAYHAIMIDAPQALISLLQTHC